MISLLFALVASAAQPSSLGVDLLVKPITAQTSAVVVDTETLDIYGGSILERIRPERGGLGNRGLLLELSDTNAILNPNRWLLSVGCSSVRNRYRFDGLTFAPTVVDLHLTGGLLAWFGQQKIFDVDGYLIMLGGLRGETLSARPIAPTSIALAPQLTLGMGLGTRTLPSRLRIEVRTDLVPHFLPGDGRVELPTKALVWRWYPASAAISILFGVGFGRPESPPPIPGPPQ